MMDEAQIRWPQAIPTMLWPYVMCHAQHNINHTPSPLLPKKGTPYEAYTSSQSRRHTSDAVPFGCPVYTTKDETCAGLPYSKWKMRATLGLYLGISPIHSRRSGLIPNLVTGLVSPRFHYKSDNKNSTIQPCFLDLPWKTKIGAQRIRYNGLRRHTNLLRFQQTSMQRITHSQTSANEERIR